MQLKETQLKSNDPVTIHLDSNMMNPPNQLSYKNLFKTKDKDIWISWLFNEIGRLAQGHNNVKGKIQSSSYLNQAPLKTNEYHVPD